MLTLKLVELNTVIVLTFWSVEKRIIKLLSVYNEKSEFNGPEGLRNQCVMLRIKSWDVWTDQLKPS